MKVWNYVVICTSLMIFLQMAGIPTATSGFFELLGIEFAGSELQQVAFKSGGFWSKILSSSGVLIAGVAAGIIASRLTNSSPENYVLLPLITGPLALYAVSIFSVMKYALANTELYIASIVLLMLGGLGAGYVLSLAEFFRGTD